MGSLFTGLINSANALRVYSQALDVVSNNVTNANTPGYVEQRAVLTAQPFDLTVGLPGGVALGGVQSARSAYAEQNVRTSQSSYGFANEMATDLSQVSNLFDATGKTGIAPAVNNLFSSFSQLSLNPNDATARNNVIAQASQVAQQFQTTSAGLASVSSQITQQSKSYVQEINSLANTIAHINSEGLDDYKGDANAGLDAQLNSSLEELSKYVNYTSLQQPNGTVTVYIAGQTPLVMGDQAQAIQGDFSSTQARILDSQGNDITSQISQGQLAASLQIQNSDIPGYQGTLDTLAQGLADQVNSTLSNGIDQNGTSPTTNLFTYNASGPASTLAVDPTITPAQIAAALPGAPGGNGNALALSALGSGSILNGYTLTGFYGNLASQVGQDISSAQSSSDGQQQVLTQAQNLRQQESGVSLDSEAATLLQFQKAYQATSKMISVINSLTDSVLGMIPSA